MITTIKQLFRPFYRPIIDKVREVPPAPKRYHHLYDEIAKLKAVKIIEIGTWNANRAVRMIAEAKKHSNHIAYIGFDLFEDLSEEMYQHELSKKPPTKKEVEKKLKATGAEITLVQGNTLKTLPEFVKNTEKVDFIFIDGGHDKNTIQSDWEAVSKLMHENTVVIFDDYWRNRDDQSAKPVVDAIDQSKYVVEILPEIDCFDNKEFGRLEISFAKVSLK